MQLNFRTRGKDISPQGKPRVFFCCHPEDFDIYFESVSQEILNLENCAIFYDEQPNGGGDTAEWQSRLADMQLFVMPVTSRLLSGNTKAWMTTKLPSKIIFLCCHLCKRTVLTNCSTVFVVICST